MIYIYNPLFSFHISQALSEHVTKMEGWHAVLDEAGLSHLASLPELRKYDLDILAKRARNDRVAAIAALKVAGVSRLGDRQRLACALGRYLHRTAADVARFVPEAVLRPRVPLVVCINVHELPGACCTVYWRF